MRYILFVTLVFLSFSVQAQEATDPSMLIKINGMLPSTDFEQMRSYILTNGDRKTYCPNYRNNPHYVMEDQGIEIYMNPAVGSGSTPLPTNYTTMYIVSRGDDTPFNYYLYLSDWHDVYLFDYNKYLSDESVRNHVLHQLDAILKGMRAKMGIE